MSIGALVRADNGLGIGKLIAIGGGRATVAYFESITQQTHLEVPVPSLRRVKVAPQTRCYVQSDDGNTWIVGRIGQCVDYHYEVHLPEKRSLYVPEAQVHVRSARSTVDPIDVLIARGHETAFFYEHRVPFVRSLVAQRAATRGLSGLVSSRVELYAHQVEVVRRVLEDPIQRYLLADEVGLGKTIEAGAILRQFLLDHAQGCALVLVPPLLVDQWRQELGDKFAIFDFAGRVDIRGTNEVAAAANHAWGMVVVDEAHHVAELAHAPGAEDRARFESFRGLAHRAERLLLLSATPALHNEAAFLAMLHLLDPAVYQLEEVDAFRQRIERRREIGNFLLAFNERMQEYPLKRSISRLRAMFPGDQGLATLVDSLEAGIGAAADLADRGRLIRRIRTHLAETYRLHQRLLRSRREAVEAGLTIGRSGKAPGALVEECDLDDHSAAVHELLEEWRIAAFAHGAGAGSDVTQGLLRVFRILVECAGTWHEILDLAVRLRLGQRDETTLRRDLRPDDLEMLRKVPLFPGEQPLLEGLQSVCAGAQTDTDRVALLIEALRTLRLEPAAGGKPVKIVVFTSFSRSANEIYRRIVARWGKDVAAIYRTDMTADGVEKAIAQFRDDPRCNLIICDRTGEEGRNLQFADVLIHFDLPLSPSRIEQRIGRVDRIGRVRRLRTRVFLGPDIDYSLFSAWYKLLADGLGVFRDSIAGLQFFVERKVPDLLRALFENGATGLEAQIPGVLKEIEEEQQRLNEQFALDEIDARSEDVQDFVNALEEFDAEHSVVQKNMETWIVDALQMKRHADPEVPHAFFYRPSRSTLIPHDFLVQRLGDHLNRPGTYRRTTAAENAGTVLYRVGEAFVDAMAEYVAWDDRGRAYAIWRVQDGLPESEGAEWVGFRFTYIVEADLSQALAVLGRHSGGRGDPHVLRRRGDSILAPRLKVIHTGIDGREVTDPAYTAALRQSYRGAKDYGRDYNLTKDRLSVLDIVVDPALWEETCREARKASEEGLLRNETVRLDLDWAATRAERLLEARLDRLRLRDAQENAPAAAIAFEQELGEALIVGVRAPSVRLDSVGVVVLSGRDPFR